MVSKSSNRVEGNSPTSDRAQEIRSVLADIAQSFGTPTYAFDVGTMRDQVTRVRYQLPSEIDLLYSLKANASLGICEVFGACGLGADVASAGELATAVEAGFSDDSIFVAGPFKLPETIDRLRSLPQTVLSVDSPSELRWLSEQGLKHRALLRLRPDFGSCAVVPAGSESRFGFTCDDLAQCREWFRDCGLDVIGFHVFAGSQVLQADELNEHLRRSWELSSRAAETLGLFPELVNLGGGFGIPYAGNSPLDLARVGSELKSLVQEAAPTRLMLELGRYFVAESGWYLASVVGEQTFQGRPAVIVDGGVHQRADMCGLCLRSSQEAPLVLRREVSSERRPTDILGCLSLPDDVLLEAASLPALAVGDVLAFGNAGAYGLWSSPALFHGSPLPAEVAFDGPKMYLMRERRPAASILEGQHHVRCRDARSLVNSLESG